MHYEIKKQIEGFDANAMKENILNSVNRNSVQSIRLSRSNKSLVFRYTYTNTEESFDIVITSDELKAA